MDVSNAYQARSEQVTVNHTSSVISYVNEDRKAAVYRNSSTGGQNITLSFGEVAAVSGQGIVLAPGQSFSDSDSENYLSWKGKINAISSADGGLLSIFER